MAASASSEQEEIITGINVTPLVDIILVLLIIFMLTANLMEKQSIKVELPEAATGETTETTTLALTVGKDGSIYLNGVIMSADELPSRLAQALEDDPGVQAIIAADKSVSHGQVIGLVDLIRQQGIYKFALNIDPVSLPQTDAP